MSAKVILINIPSDDPKGTAEFYSELMGIEFARSFSDSHLAFHAPISDDGRLLQIQQRYAKDEGVTCYFAVDDIHAAIADLTKKGAKALGQPMDLPISGQVISQYKDHYKQSFGGDAAETLGLGVVLQDPAGNRFGLIQLDDHAHVMFRYGKHATSPRHVSDEHRAIHSRTVAIGKLMK